MYRISYIFCYLIFIVNVCQGQTRSIDSLKVEFDKLYGYDVLLNNGRKYFEGGNPVIGQPFWKNQDPFVADLTFSGRTFKGQLLKYNLHKQEFILVYKNLNGQLNQIILNNSTIDSITTGNCLFIPRISPEIAQPFVQQIYSGKISCYLGRYKNLQFNTTGVNTGYKYSKDLSIYYIFKEGTLTKLVDRSSFLHIFQDKDRVLIRKYMASKKFRFKKMNENNWRDLISYCNKTVQ
jgi:hypothetical protein